MAESSKKRRRPHLTWEEKVMVFNVYQGLRARDTSMSVSEAVTTCSFLTRVSERSVYSVKKEFEKENEDIKKEKKKEETRGRKSIIVDEDTRRAIRRIVHSFYFRNEIPNLKKIKTAIEADPSLPNLKDKVLRRTMRQMNFRYLNRKRKSVLVEKDEIVLWRRKYLSRIRDYRNEGRKIYYTDETWLNEGHTVMKVWQDLSIESSRQAFIDGLSTGLKAPSGKGRRLIITHIGSDEGFLEEGLSIFESKSTKDYHEEMDAERYEEWLKTILRKVEPGSVIVMDNAPYHSRRLEKLPTSAWRKGQIIEWLSEKNIPHEDSMLKVELLDIARQHKANYTKYVVDEMAKEHNIIILRLPPYHCELNPIELIWAQAKTEVARNNRTFKIADVRKLFDDALQNITADTWRKCIQHVKKEEMRMWELDVRVEITTELLIININGDSSSSLDSSDSESNNDSEQKLH